MNRMRRRFALVYNARAGLALPRLLDRVLQHLRGTGSEVFQLPARNAHEAAERVEEAARQQSCDAVIAAGGDGTFRAVATGAGGTSLPVGIIPLGTGNVLAHEIGLGRGAEAVARTLLDAPTATIRGGLVNGAPFFLMTGAGLDARIVSRLDYRAKRAFGRGAYTGPVLRTLSDPVEMFDVEIDGRMFEASWVILALASRYGGAFELTRQTSVGAGRLIAVVIAARNRRQQLLAATALALGRLTDERTRPNFVTVLPAQSAHVGRLIETKVQVDGDEAGITPVAIDINGPYVELIAPPAYVADLTNRQTNHVQCES